jgi:hypothetical protein
MNRRVGCEWHLLNQKTVFASVSAVISKQCRGHLPKKIATSQAPRNDIVLALSKCHSGQMQIKFNVYLTPVKSDNKGFQ